MSYGMQDNSNYKMVVTSNARWGSVSGYIPEQFNLSVHSQFNQPFGQELLNSTLGTTTKVVAGLAPISQSMTGQIWEGSKPIDLSMEMDLIAEYDPVMEVQERIKSLMKMALPSRGGAGLLKTPGPSYGSVTGREALNAVQGWTGIGSPLGKADGVISIAIGNFLFFDNVVIESVQAQFQSMMHRTGVPLHATVTINFSTFFIVLAEDLDNIFVNRSAATQSATPGVVGTPVGGQTGQPQTSSPGTLGGLLQTAETTVNNVRQQAQPYFDGLLDKFGKFTGISF